MAVFLENEDKIAQCRTNEKDFMHHITENMKLTLFR
jgi:hypothetical protein